jgi:glutathione S-transferase
MNIRLFVVHNSHPCAAVERALALKGLSYRVVEWPPPFHAAAQRLIFGARTVPGLIIDGEKVQGTRAIFHRLDELVPEPVLYPSQQVEEADRWGDEELQQVPRDLIWAVGPHRPEMVLGFSEGSRIPLPRPAVRAVAPLIAHGQRRLNKTSDTKAQQRLTALPSQVAQIDAWIKDGTIGDAGNPNAADLQILASVRLLQTVADARPFFVNSPSVQLADELFGGPLNAEVPGGVLG